MIAHEAFEEAAHQSMLMFQVTDDRFDRRPAAKARPHLRTFPLALPGFGFAGEQHFGFVHFFAAPIATIHDGFGGLLVGDGAGLCQRRLECSAVVKIFFMRHRADDHPVRLGHHHRGFAAKFIFLVFLAFAQAIDLGFVQGVNLVPVSQLLA